MQSQAWYLLQICEYLDWLFIPPKSWKGDQATSSDSQATNHITQSTVQRVEDEGAVVQSEKQQLFEEEKEQARMRFFAAV